MATKHYCAYPKPINGGFRAMHFTDDTHLADFFKETSLNLEYTQVSDGVTIIENEITVDLRYGDWILIYHEDYIILDNEDFTRMFRVEELPNVEI